MPQRIVKFTKNVKYWPNLAKKRSFQMRKQSGERQNFSKFFFALFLELYLATLVLVAGIFYSIVTTLVLH